MSDNKKKHHLIFEGAELVGKSFLISQIYNQLEKEQHTHPKILDGCHWFNCDLGFFGTNHTKKIINEYVDILKILKSKNTIFEKFHLSDIVYNQIYNHKKINYIAQEKVLAKLSAKLILVTVNKESVFAERIADRLRNVPHYKRIAQSPADYWQMQEKYLEVYHNSKLPKLIVDCSYPLNKNFVRQQVKKISSFINS